MVGCAVLCGRHTGPFEEMVAELRGSHAASVWQVDDAAALAAALGQLLADSSRLAECQRQATQAVEAARSGTLERAWTTLNERLLRPALEGSPRPASQKCRI
jgi:3-deoxy-D-manno-octulosonic-acid transferase